jgi:hypothetical protein
MGEEVDEGCWQTEVVAKEGWVVVKRLWWGQGL